jgi:DNA-binding IclR family transcriptional regulator
MGMAKAIAAKKLPSSRQGPSLSRALAILDLFTGDCLTWSADAICQALGYSQPTGYRYIREFVAAGLLLRIAGSSYTLGPRIISLDYAMRQADPLLHAAIPVMHDIAVKTGCDCLLSALFGRQILDTHREAGADSLELAYARGRARPMFIGAASKVILAAQSTSWLHRLYEERAEDISTAGLGDNWIAFRSTLRKVQRANHYISRGEIDPDLSAIAVPIQNEAHETTEAIALVTSTSRLDLLNVPILITMLQLAASQIGGGDARKAIIGSSMVSVRSGSVISCNFQDDLAGQSRSGTW